MVSWRAAGGGTVMGGSYSHSHRLAQTLSQTGSLLSLAAHTFSHWSDIVCTLTDECSARSLTAQPFSHWSNIAYTLADGFIALVMLKDSHIGRYFGQ